MAIIKAIELKNGVEVNYHNVGVYLNKVDNFLIARVTSWVNLEKKEEGKDSAYSEEFTIPKEEWLEKYKNGDNVAEIAYSYIKSLEKYEGGEDA